MSFSRAICRAVPAVLGGAAAAVLLRDVLRLDRRLPMLAAVARRPQAVVGVAAAGAALGAWRTTRPAGVALGTVAAAGPWQWPVGCPPGMTTRLVLPGPILR